MTTLIKKKATTDQVVKFAQVVALRTKDSQAIDALLERLPFSARYTWFEKMFWLIDSLTEYKYDDPGREQIKTPNEFLFNLKEGDCDDYSVLWMALLNRVNVKSMPKIVDYENDGHWDHIYVVVPLRNGDYITLDNVMGKFRKKFNKEVDYKDKKIFRPLKF